MFAHELRADEMVLTAPHHSLVKIYYHPLEVLRARRRRVAGHFQMISGHRRKLGSYPTARFKMSAQSGKVGISQGPVRTLRSLIVLLAFFFVASRDLFEKSRCPGPFEF